MGFRNAVYPFSVFLFNFFSPHVCVWLFVCVWRKKNNFSDPFASPLNLHAIFSHLEWGGMHHPMLFLFSFLMSHAFFFFISSFPFIVWSSGAVYFWIFFGRLFLWNAIAVCFFGRRQSSCSISWTSSLYVYFFFLNLGDAKNWQQKERKKNGFIERAGTVTWLVAFFPPP